ncbi:MULTISPECIES: hypothetical protein [Peptoniphilaceae]|uniref:Uncharacterized protein n=2 Tax=Peptoniphilaceae TaxID=1570339 RepID=F0H2S7_9FIRM|nr:hypothetical protein [Anaerococcus hydrogenalis]EGC83231.1 hypothetical protein HMPREF9246_0376 [Anaerococcus hydrogenalis ACS-025-V-Sch4]HEQ5509223.1 hypothetical protein [Streptococcus pyogenes]
MKNSEDLKNKEVLTSCDSDANVEKEFDYELEGYATCQTASRRCEQDCLGSCFMTCDN